MKFNLADITALVVVLACFTLIGLHIDGEVKSTLTIAVGWVFGSGYQKIKIRK